MNELEVAFVRQTRIGRGCEVERCLFVRWPHLPISPLDSVCVISRHSSSSIMSANGGDQRRRSVSSNCDAQLTLIHDATLQPFQLHLPKPILLFTGRSDLEMLPENRRRSVDVFGSVDQLIRHCSNRCSGDRRVLNASVVERVNACVRGKAKVDCGCVRGDGGDACPSVHETGLCSKFNGGELCRTIQPTVMLPISFSLLHSPLSRSSSDARDDQYRENVLTGHK